MICFGCFNLEFLKKFPFLPKTYFRLVLGFKTYFFKFLGAEQMGCFWETIFNQSRMVTVKCTYHKDDKS